MPILGTRPRPKAVRHVAVAAVFALSATLAGCNAADDEIPAAGDTPGSTPSPSKPPKPQATVTDNLPAHDAVPVSQEIELQVDDGTFEKVHAYFGKKEKPLEGEVSDDGTTWTNTQRLEPGVRYRIEAVAVDENGLETRKRTSFRTDDLTLDEQTYPSIAPLQGETVGVGMPVIVKFDIAVTDKASIERHLRVESTPQQKGEWHWISDHEVHWRPKSYWQPGTEVTVHADINSIPAGNGIYGQLSRETSFHVGDSVVSKVDLDTHRMKVFINGDLARTIPISAGKEGWETRSGVKVIIEKFREKRMDASTIGVDPGDPEYYNIEEVPYAMRVTYSGEFLHGAPWSVASQGEANVSHGCVGMSIADAEWMYNISKRGDVVEVTGSDKWMTLTNGYGDWNLSFREYSEGSALS
jgi:lipoprotein-anchoring transpeptidase ErfK/SrfK